MAGVDEPTVGELHRTMTQLRTDTQKGFERVEKAIADLHRDFVPTAVFDAKHGALVQRVDELASSKRASVMMWIAVVSATGGIGTFLVNVLTK